MRALRLPLLVLASALVAAACGAGATATPVPSAQAPTPRTVRRGAIRTRCVGRPVGARADRRPCRPARSHLPLDRRGRPPARAGLAGAPRVPRRHAARRERRLQLDGRRVHDLGQHPPHRRADDPDRDGLRRSAHGAGHLDRRLPRRRGDDVRRPDARPDQRRRYPHAHGRGSREPGPPDRGHDVGRRGPGSRTRPCRACRSASRRRWSSPTARSPTRAATAAAARRRSARARSPSGRSRRHAWPARSPRWTSSRSCSAC